MIILSHFLFVTQQNKHNTVVAIVAENWFRCVADGAVMHVALVKL